MSLQQAAYLAEIIGVAAVIASLLFLSFEVRRNTAEAKLSNWTSAIDRFNALFSRTSREDLPEVLERGRLDYDGLSGSEKIIFGNYLFETCLSYEAMIIMGRDQVQGEDLEELPHKQLRYHFGFPGTRQWWKEFDATLGLSPVMTKVIERAIAEGEVRLA